MSSDEQLDQLTMNADQLYREEVFTDRQTGSIRRLTPVDSDGQTDSSRKVCFVGQTQVMTPAGALPLSFELAGPTLGEAVGQFAAGAEQGIQEAMEEIRKMQQESQSSIMVPGQGGGQGGGGMGGGQGGMPGGGLKL